MQQETIIKQETQVSPEEIEGFALSADEEAQYRDEPVPDDSVGYKLELVNNVAGDTLVHLNDTGEALDGARMVQLTERMKLKDGLPATEKDRVILDALSLDAALGIIHEEHAHSVRGFIDRERTHNEVVEELNGQILHLDESLDRLAAKNVRQERYMQVGAGVGAAVAVAGIVAYMRQKKAHDTVIQVLEETALLLEAELAETVCFDFDELAAEVFEKVGAIETRSFRRPFAIKASELERAMRLLVGLLRTSETLALQYANLTLVAPIDVEAEAVEAAEPSEAAIEPKTEEER